MGEHRVRMLNGLPSAHKISQKRVPMTRDLRIEEVPSEGVMVMILGNSTEAMAIGMKPEEARKLAEALTKHAERLEQTTAPRIIPASRIDTTPA